MVKVDWRTLLHVARAKLLNCQGLRGSRKVARVHYDLGNDFFESMLDPQMQYSCGYWSGGAQDLAQAQEAKLDLICRKLRLAKGDTILELGCGWGGFARFAATRYGAVVTGYTISTEQAQWARRLCQGLDVEIRLADYREATGTFDHVVSVGMFEHVGPKNYDAYFGLAKARLRQGGRFLLHTIASPRKEHMLDPWFDRYIFPGAVLPCFAGIANSVQSRFQVEDWHNFGPDYDRTLMAWFENFQRDWPLFRERYGEPFGRMWSYYLLSLAGCFRARSNYLWQILMRNGRLDGDLVTIR